MNHLRPLVLALQLSCANDGNPAGEDAGDVCRSTEMRWSSSVSDIMPPRACSTDDECAVVSISFTCDREGERWAMFLQGCEYAAHRDEVESFIAERDRLSAELCDSLTEPLCVVTGCNVDGGSPAVLCIAGQCTKQ